ncbi:MAG: adenosine kinase [Pseudomonadales bacterium]
MSRYHVYGIGAALVDTEIEVSDADLQEIQVDKGLMTLVDQQRQHELIAHLEGHMVHSRRASGGSACNSIIAASCFGANTYYSCKVSDDDNGHFYMGDLKAAGVDANFDAPREAGITGKCLVLITPDAERSMNTYLGISETLSEAELNLEAIENSEYVYMEGYLVTSPTGRAAAIKARQHAQANGVKTAISLSDPGMVEFFRDGLAEMIGDGVDLLFCNEAEAKGWAATDQLDLAVSELKKIAKTFAITLGAQGALVFDGNELIEIAAYPTKAVDTNGAGDMFAGAFLYGLSAGQSFAQAGALASRAASAVVADFGPRLAVEKHAQLLAE